MRGNSHFCRNVAPNVLPRLAGKREEEMPVSCPLREPTSAHRVDLKHFLILYVKGENERKRVINLQKPMTLIGYPDKSLS